MLKKQAEGTFLNLISLLIYGREETGVKLIDRDSCKGKKRAREGVKTYLPEHVFLKPILTINQG